MVSPSYVAETTYVPATVGVQVQLALVEDSDDVVQRILFDASLNKTTPVAPAVTVATKVIEAPASGVVLEAEKVVVVTA